MATTAVQDPTIRRWAEEIDEVSERTRALTSDLTEQQLRWSPPEGGWSIARVFEHLASSHRSYLEMLPRVIEGARENAPPSIGGAWRPSFAGGLLLRSLDPSSRRRVPAPGGWRPAAEASGSSVGDFLGTQEEVKRLLADADGLDLRRVRTHSPVSRLLPLNLGDCFAIIAVHGRRHMGQVERIRAHAAFPREAA
jgi:hypothetical protein